ncbi:MAG: CAP domain-containing protein [Pirellulales bacterium]|nr:CAP domain-containing protein [Pirellulales bacterium]
MAQNRSSRSFGQRRSGVTYNMPKVTRTVPQSQATPRYSMPVYSAPAVNTNGQRVVYSQPRPATSVSQVVPHTVAKPVTSNQVIYSTPNYATGTVTSRPATYSTPIVLNSAPAIPNYGGDSAYQVVSLVNSQRARYGLAPLNIDAGLMSTANAHASWMARSNSMQHGRYPVAENIAMGQRSPGEAMNSWMNSSGHRANILGRYSSIGVGVAYSSGGQMFWCQQFR